VKATVLSGGVGGARFLRGVISVLDPEDVVVVGNVGDDIEILGLHVSPDLDSVLYALADLADEERGWGRADETWNALETVATLGGEAWFKLGDRDLGLHLVRTQLLREGAPLSAVTDRLARSLGLRCTVLPATDDPLRTFVETPAGTFPFQEWFVARGHRDEVDAVHYTGARDAAAAPGVVEALEDADLIMIAPSNPYVSVGPILAIAEIRAALEQRRVPCVAVSPLIGGRAVKGPADRMLTRLAGGTGPDAVAACYPGLIDALVLDEQDAPDGIEAVRLPGEVRPVVARTLMTDEDARRRLVHAVLDAAAAVT
jgi:LPPG:FO 2-phospho-L-lactate transferase